MRPGEKAPPPGWAVVSARPLRQMAADAADLAAIHPAEEVLAELGPDDAADMLALAEVAKPGPFGSRTGALGRFVSRRGPNGWLLAMAGGRFCFAGHVELCTVCAHPEARGRGLGAAVTLRFGRDVLVRGEAPLLLALSDNLAVGLYARLGFRERATTWILWHRPVPA